MMVEEETWRFLSVYFDLWTLRCSSSYLVKQEIYFNIKRFFKKSNWIDESLSDKSLASSEITYFWWCAVMKNVWNELNLKKWQQSGSDWSMHTIQSIYFLNESQMSVAHDVSIEETIKAICSEVNVFNSLSYRSHSKTP